MLPLKYSQAPQSNFHLLRKVIFPDLLLRMNVELESRGFTAWYIVGLPKLYDTFTRLTIKWHLLSILSGDCVDKTCNWSKTTLATETLRRTVFWKRSFYYKIEKHIFSQMWDLRARTKGWETSEMWLAKTGSISGKFETREKCFPRWYIHSSVVFLKV